MKKKICVLTATRAEYGLLKPVILKLMADPNFDVRVVVTGAHLSPEFGLTYKEIGQDGIPIDEKIEILLSGDTPIAISKSMGLALLGFADYFARQNPNLLMVLGDRYETLAVCCAAMNQRIPIVHLYGGEITEGAVDECIRHAITKLSYLHFTSTEQYRNRVIQLGEQPDRVFCVGAIGIENILQEELLSKSELEVALNFKLDKPYAMVTFHPVTLKDNNSAEQFKAVLDVCKKHKEMKFVFSKANADANGRIINQMLDAYVKENENSIAFASLGMVRYLSTVKYSAMVMGNSSSGLVEAPSLRVPTINIGDRQKGRLQADSIINCKPLSNEIEKAIALALTDKAQNRARNTINPYGDGNTSEKIVAKVKEFSLSGKIDLKKKFYDCEVR
ncbi:UDP-N-acetyl-D-glucosamine 2-epimerase, UDP-hydrolysing [Desulfitobacterium dichloroeliminans LMG P-21439]|uniref:UDP-N-acetyl-D-glucosamine 2-epimerase, UDP-hydrolysing n=1 Tax=Desulfitobacterium dichloroeliminans (strain LMG P-21439 / DCA1) TaxID=871963 RepID=L0FBL6_DESDL|nr:UDP-N-acetylglucosamine 2-epimerase [Desulfitobacterium dichloroeliminans]AGA70602.1 UDP-N-acetyl-D-glucosamine 2-epimerase, UDP-hydrolysing [Desulfitobacterium dichloroeliminans LMG P-21439]